MSHILFEKLEKAGFMRGMTLKRSAIEHASPVEILDFAEESCALTSAKNLSQDNSVLAHSGSLSVGCSRWPCAALDCRLTRAERLVQFAALYSDRVYIRNFFSDYVEHLDDKHLPDESKLRAQFAEDLEILAYLRPLIESKKVLPITSPNYCLHCLAKHSLGLEDDKQLKKAFRLLEHRMENEIDASLSILKGKIYCIMVKGPEDLLYHGFSGSLDKQPPPNLSKMPRIFAQVRNGKTVHLSKWALRKIGIASHLASYHCESIIFELSLAQCLKTGFLTDMPLHIDLLKRISSVPPTVERDLLVEKHLTCLVPFLKELSPKEILKVRQNEAESFILFKSALIEAIDEYRRNYGRFNESDARALYLDILRPKLTELENKVRKAQRAIIKGSVHKVLAWTAAISFGIYAGFLGEGLVSAAAALGLTKILADFAEDLMTKSDIEETARGHSMYFLWRVKKMARSK